MRQIQVRGFPMDVRLTSQGNFMFRHPEDATWFYPDKEMFQSLTPEALRGLAAIKERAA